MGMNNKGLQLVKNFEGLRLTAYKCAAGVWTIGWGHTGKVNGKQICKGMKITKEVAEKLLLEDLKYFYDAVCNKSFVPICDSLNENQKSALASFAFNCGVNNLKTLCMGRNANQIANAILLYNKANGKVLKGLKDRREAERKLFLMDVEKTESAESKTVVNLPTIKKGCTGIAVKLLQAKLKVNVDGDFGEKTKTALTKFQKERKIPADGICGAGTWEEIIKTM